MTPCAPQVDRGEIQAVLRRRQTASCLLPAVSTTRGLSVKSAVARYVSFGVRWGVKTIESRFPDLQETGSEVRILCRDGRI